jgi:hypothetical protein
MISRLDCCMDVVYSLALCTEHGVCKCGSVSVFMWQDAVATTQVGLTGSAPLNPQLVLQNYVFFSVQQMIDKFHAESNPKNFGFCLKYSLRL